jgi:O-antigen ligase/polysaccharide polymerase Wzy-like membrane protein
MNLGIALFGALILMVISSWNWRRAVKTALVLAVIEGAIRKWVLPGASDLVYFMKDIILLGAYARYFIYEHKSKRAVALPELKILLWIAMILVGLQVFNIRLASAAVGMFGFKAYLLYVPLCFMLRDVFRSTEELQSFLKWYLLLVIPVGALGALQFFSPPDSPINTYVAGEEADIATFGGSDDIVRARITGTFSYISGYTAYLTVCQALLFSLLAVKLNKVWMAILMGSQALLMGNMFMTGSRGPVFSGVIVFAGFLIFNQMARAREVRKALTMLLLTGVMCAVASVYWFSDALDAFWQRVTTSDSASERMSSSFMEPLLFLSDPEVLGYGAGATHPGGAGLRARFGLTEPSVAPPEAENETVRVMLELGVFGFLVWYALKLYLILALWRTRVQTRNPFLKNLALAAFLVHAILFTGATVLNHTAHIYFWFMAGFIFLLPRLDSIVAHERLENNHYTDGSGNGQPHKLPVATATGIVKSVSGLKHIHH